MAVSLMTDKVKAEWTQPGKIAAQRDRDSWRCTATRPAVQPVVSFACPNHGKTIEFEYDHEVPGIPVDSHCYYTSDNYAEWWEHLEHRRTRRRRRTSATSCETATSTETKVSRFTGVVRWHWAPAMPGAFGATAARAAPARRARREPADRRGRRAYRVETCWAARSTRATSPGRGARAARSRAPGAARPADRQPAPGAVVGPGVPRVGARAREHDRPASRAESAPLDAADTPGRHGRGLPGTKQGRTKHELLVRRQRDQPAVRSFGNDPGPESRVAPTRVSFGRRRGTEV